MITCAHGSCQGSVGRQLKETSFTINASFRVHNSLTTKGQAREKDGMFGLQGRFTAANCIAGSAILLRLVTM